MFYCLLWHVSCIILFLACFSLDLCSFILVHMFFCPDLCALCFVLCALCYMFMLRSIVSMCCLARSACFYACLHAYMFRSTCLGFYAMLSFVSLLFSLYFDVRVMCSHAWYHFYGYTLLGSMCSCAFRHVLCLDPHPYMLICLDSCSSMFMC